MSNPTKAKDAKPKTETDDFEIKQTTKVETNNSGTSLVAVIIIVLIAVAAIIATNFIFVDMKMKEMSAKISEIAVSSTDDSNVDADESVSAERGIILDLGEFILNLADSNSRKFLKVNVAIELSKKASDDVAPKKSGGHGHGGGDDNAMSHIETEMNQYKPAIRDSIISVLSSKTSDELATTPGKEISKEQIKEAVDAIFEGNREVLRVSFGSFFIQ